MGLEFGLGLVNGLVVSGLCAACFLLAAQGRLPAALAPLPRLSSHLWVQIVVAVVLLDLFTYALHRAYHRVPVLWRFHSVHHTDLDLDVSSASRFHTGEVVFSSVVQLGAVTVLGIPPGVSRFRGHDARLRAVPAREHPGPGAAGGDPLGDARAAGDASDPPRPEPSGHGFHDGTIFTLWDLLFRSFNRRAPDAAPAFGLAGTRDPDRLGPGVLAVLLFRRQAAG